MAMSGQRDENPYVNQQQVQQDVEALYRAGQGKIGTVSCSVYIETGYVLNHPGRDWSLRYPTLQI